MENCTTLAHRRQGFFRADHNSHLFFKVDVSRKFWGIVEGYHPRGRGRLFFGFRLLEHRAKVSRGVTHIPAFFGSLKLQPFFF